MIKILDKKVTPKQAAASMIHRALHNQIAFWNENSSINYSEMTDKEIKAVEEQMMKISMRLIKKLGKRS